MSGGSGVCEGGLPTQGCLRDEVGVTVRQPSSVCMDGWPEVVRSVCGHRK